eukprot:205463-Alexandrium_andersonii.AAC.1
MCIRDSCRPFVVDPPVPPEWCSACDHRSLAPIPPTQELQEAGSIEHCRRQEVLRRIEEQKSECRLLQRRYVAA